MTISFIAPTLLLTGSAPDGRTHVNIYYIHMGAPQKVVSSRGGGTEFWRSHADVERQRPEGVPPAV